MHRPPPISSQSNAPYAGLLRLKVSSGLKPKQRPQIARASNRARSMPKSALASPGPRLSAEYRGSIQLGGGIAKASPDFLTSALAGSSNQWPSPKPLPCTCRGSPLWGPEGVREGRGGEWQTQIWSVLRGPATKQAPCIPSTMSLKKTQNTNKTPPRPQNPQELLLNLTATSS